MSFTPPPGNPPPAPDAPSRDDSEDLFDVKANAQVAWFAPFTVWLTSFIAWVVTYTAELTAAFTTATDAATTATDEAGLAMGYRNEANAAKNAAALSEGTATTKAGEASDSADAAAASADAAGQSRAAVDVALASIADGPVVSVNGKTGVAVIAVADIPDAAPKASPTLTGLIALSGSVRGVKQAIAALDLDCSLGNYFAKTIAANSTFTFSNAPAAPARFGMVLELTHTSGTVAWPAGVIWSGGTVPQLTTGKVHLFFFLTANGGATWRAAALPNYAS